MSFTLMRENSVPYFQLWEPYGYVEDGKVVGFEIPPGRFEFVNPNRV